MNAHRIAKISVFTAFLSALSILSAIPTPSGVPLTLQPFAVALIGFCLGKKDGTFSILIYIIIGAIGVPVFSGMKGGLVPLFDITGGFIFGFLFLAFFSGFKLNSVFSILFSLLGLALCHIFGVIQFSFITKNSLKASFVLVSLPYIAKDIISVIFAFLFKKILIKKILFCLQSEKGR